MVVPAGPAKLGPEDLIPGHSDKTLPGTGRLDLFTLKSSIHEKLFNRPENTQYH